MAEQTEDLDDSVTFDELVRFFKTVSPEVKCMSCGDSRWTVMLEDDEVKVSEASLGKEGSFLKYFPVFLTVCHTCGYVKAHHATVIRAWLLENPKPDLKQDGESE
jgi:hypothetical protein